MAFFGKYVNDNRSDKDDMYLWKKSNFQTEDSYIQVFLSSKLVFRCSVSVKHLLVEFG